MVLFKIRIIFKQIPQPNKQCYITALMGLVYNIDIIVTMVMSWLQVKVAALQDLVKVMSLFYQYMEAYMGPALFAVSLSVLP